MGYRKETNNNKGIQTVAEWLIEEELADYTIASFFLEDTINEFAQDMEKFRYSLHLLYEAQKDNPSDLLRKVESLRSGIPLIHNLNITIFMPQPPPPHASMPPPKNLPPVIPPALHAFQLEQ